MENETGAKFYFERKYTIQETIIINEDDHCKSSQTTWSCSCGLKGNDDDAKTNKDNEQNATSLECHTCENIEHCKSNDIEGTPSHQYSHDDDVKTTVVAMEGQVDDNFKPDPDKVMHKQIGPNKLPENDNGNTALIGKEIHSQLKQPGIIENVIALECTVLEDKEIGVGASVAKNESSDGNSNDSKDLHNKSEGNEETNAIFESENGDYAKDLKLIKCKTALNNDSLHMEHEMCKKHMRTPCVDESLQCEVCKRKFDCADVLRNHLVNHLKDDTQQNGKTSKCTECGMKFRNTRGLDKHIITKHPTTELDCHICGKKLPRGQLKIHMNAHDQVKSFKCDLCSKAFMRNEHLTRHKIQVHSEGPSNYYKCKKCTMEFRNDQSLRNHVNRDHREELPFKCRYCSLGCVTVERLKEHENTHTGIKPFKCDVCNKLFNRRQNLKRHKLIHSGRKPFQCEHCDLAFTQKGNLTTHMRLHTNDRPYECMFCDKSFPQKLQMTSHEKIHTGERPFECSICLLRCITKQDLNNHMKIHDAITFKCDFCNKQFSRKYYLNLHKKANHGNG